MNLFNTMEKLLIIAKAIAYGAFALFVYIDFVGGVEFADTMNQLGIFGQITYTEQSLQIGMKYISSQLIYTTITLAILECLANVLSMWK